MKAFLIRVLVMWLSRLGHAPEVPTPAPLPEPLGEPVDLATFAEDVVRWVEAKGIPAHADQYKRALAYNRLVKAFPHVRRRDVSQALEAAVRAVKA